MKKRIEQRIEESIQTKENFLKDENLIEAVCQAAALLVDTLENGGKVLFCGNGGSASDALHIAGELMGRFQKERKAYAAIALNADMAILTAVANDYGYDYVYARQVEGLMNEKDVLVGISTSGNSENVCRAMEAAEKKGGKVIALTGEDGGKLSKADILINVPSKITARIQECHIMIGHIICEIVEERLL